MATFHFFSCPRMPSELQDQIWKYAISAIPHRTIEIRKDSSSNKTIHQSLKPWPYSLDNTSHSTIPALLHVCSRSRQLAQQRWTLAFAVEEQIRKVEGGIIEHVRIPKIWFDFESDILLFLGTLNTGRKLNYNVTDAPKLFTSLERDRVRNIAVPFGNLGSDDFSHSKLKAIKTAFPNVKKMVLTYSKSYPLVWVKGSDLGMEDGKTSNLGNLDDYFAAVRISEEFEKWGIAVPDSLIIAPRHKP